MDLPCPVLSDQLQRGSTSAIPTIETEGTLQRERNYRKGSFKCVNEVLSIPSARPQKKVTTINMAKWTMSGLLPRFQLSSGSIQVETDQNPTVKALKIDTEPQKWGWTPLNLNSGPYKIDLNRNKIRIILKMCRIQCKVTHHIHLSKWYTETQAGSLELKNTKNLPNGFNCSMQMTEEIISGRRDH